MLFDFTYWLTCVNKQVCTHRKQICTPRYIILFENALQYTWKWLALSDIDLPSLPRFGRRGQVKCGWSREGSVGLPELPGVSEPAPPAPCRLVWPGICPGRVVCPGSGLWPGTVVCPGGLIMVPRFGRPTPKCIKIKTDRQKNILHNWQRWRLTGYLLISSLKGDIIVYSGLRNDSTKKFSMVED